MNVAGGVSVMNTGILFALFTEEFGSGPAEYANAIVLIMFVGFLYMMSPQLELVLDDLRQMADRGDRDE
ncbi:hypothetical protein C5B90_06380 [Haloferax sp. Atlit-12N]|uniref:hypothetical protein n=1 Tax=Haloferax sp. Atlit-12N TaxID=2077203 RepID=UPI000E21FCEF|nr:hypothetical protein [Haloferax sp. Atlit-12N]RDZ65970.1 hypothetical protein C5B90_06380 [Haloferax sp. Atlit-12N]